MGQFKGFGSLDLSGVQEEQGRKTLAPGSYICKIKSAAIKDTKDGTGKGLVVELNDVNGSGEVQEWITVHHRNEEAVEIGMRRLKALLVAARHPNPDRPGDVTSLVGLTVGVHVEESEAWTDRNGQTRKGGGRPRKYGAYYQPNSEGVPEPAHSKPDAFDDRIPF